MVCISPKLSEGSGEPASSTKGRCSDAAGIEVARDSHEPGSQ